MVEPNASQEPQAKRIEAPALEPTLLAPPRRRGSGHMLLGLISGLFIVLLLAGGVLVAGLALGRINLDLLRPTVIAALQQRLGPNYRIDIGDLSVERQPHTLALAVSDLTVTHPDGRRVLEAPKADIAFDALALLMGKVQPSRVDIEDLTVALRILPDGGLDVTAGLPEQEAPVVAAVEPANPPTFPPVTAGPTPRAKIIRQAGAAINSIFDLSARGDSPIAGLDHFGVRRGRLVIDDRAAGQSRGFDQFELSLDKGHVRGRDVTNVAVSALGPNGKWSIKGSALGARGEPHRLSLEASGFTIDEAALIAGKTKLPVDSDMRLSVKADAAFESDGHLAQAEAQISLGDGFWRFDDPDFAPVFVDEVFLSARWDPVTHGLALDHGQIFAGDTRFFLRGAISPPPREDMPWMIVVENAEPCQIGPDRRGDKTVTLTRLRAELALDPPNKALTIGRVEVAGPEAALALQGSVDWSNGPHLRLGLSAGRTSAAAVLALWPNMAGSPARNWLGEHLLSGTLEHLRLALDLDEADLKMMRAQLPPMDDRIAVDYAMRDASLSFLDGVPPLVGVAGIGRSTGRATKIAISAAAIDAGPGRRLEMSDGQFSMPDMLSKPPPMIVGAHIKGAVDALGDILSRPGFAKVAAMPLDPKTIKGQFEGVFAYRTKITELADQSQGRIEANAKVENFSAEHIFGKEKLEQATLTVSVGNASLQVTGTGKIFGAPASVEMNRNGEEQAQGVVTATLDDAARARAGFNLGSSVTGPIQVRAEGPIGVAHAEGQIELDFSRAALNYPLPGLFKPAGRPGKASFTLREDERGNVTLDQINYDGSGQTARGMAQIGPDSSLIAAKFAPLRFSPGDNLQVEASKSGETLKITAHGEALDVRPFLKGLSGDSGRPDNADIDLDLHANLLTGANRQIISNAALHAARKGGLYRALAFSGKLGADRLEGALSNPDAGAPVLRVATSDAGALLAFLDLYGHMEGGALDCVLRLNASGFQGRVDVENFVLRGEPAMRSFANTAQTEQLAGQIRIDPDVVSFARLHALLEKNGGRLAVRDAVISSPNIGATMDGWIDFDRDLLDLTGTFVPAYGVNNLFGQLPVFGQILAGGSREGLFGLNYRVTGKSGAPVLSINPLSAIAPGFLRKIFGVAPGEAPAPSGR